MSGFLQRIGRGNRRSGVCRVLAFRASDEDELLIRALVDCGRRGELDDIHEYDRPSVRFQQILSLCWKATREDRPLSVAALCTDANDLAHTAVVNDMIERGCLISVRGALIPCDRLMDDADAGQIHTVIAGRAGSAVVDMRTGTTAIRDADASAAGGAVFHGGSMRRLMAGSEGSTYLGEAASRTQPLARIRGTGPALPMSRSVLWGLARERGFDPIRWQLGGAELVTWGGQIFNTLLAALFARQAPDRRFAIAPEAITGPILLLDLSLDSIRELARSAEAADDLPLSIAGKFTNPSRYLNELSNGLSAQEKRRSIPWAPFQRWLDRIDGIDIVGSMPIEIGGQEPGAL